jgi:hypothetical protein
MLPERKTLTLPRFQILLKQGKNNIGKKEEADDCQPHFFDNPKTNLTYEKNLYILLFKYHAKSCTNIKPVFG